MMTQSYTIKKHNEEICKDPNFLQFIKTWVEKHIKYPIQGFEQKTSPQGGYMNAEELLDQTHHQVIQVACYFRARGKSLNEIMEILSFFKK